MIATHPRLPGGEPFPTLYWLTCPFLSGAVAGAESAGELAAWQTRLARDSVLAGRVRAADAHYRSLRTVEAGEDVDPCSGVGIAGQQDPLGTKCLHARVAAFLGGVDDPLGEEFVVRHGDACEDARCGGLTCLREEPA